MEGREEIRGLGGPQAGQPLPCPAPLAGGARQAQQLRLLWDRRRLLLGATVAGLLASTLLALLLPNSYTSTAQLMPPDPQSSTSLAMMATLANKNSSGMGPLAGDLLGLKSTGALFVGILRSDAAQSRLVEQFDLKEVYRKRLAQDAREELDQHTIVSEDRKSGIITIRVTDHSPQRAAALANAYVDQLNVLIAGLSTSAAHRERVFLQERLRLAKQELDNASGDLARFSSQNSTLDLQTMGKVALDAAGDLAGELIAAQAQLQELRQIYTDENSRVRALSARVAELRKQLQKMGGERPEMPGRARASVQAAAERSPSSDLPYPSLRSLPLLDVKYADYYRRGKIQETVYELLTQQYELAKIQEAKETPTIKVLDHPKVAEKKSSPPRMLISALGTFLTFCACLLGVLAAERWRRWYAQDPRKVLAQQVAREVGRAANASGNWLARGWCCCRHLPRHAARRRC